MNLLPKRAQSLSAIPLREYLETLIAKDKEASDKALELQSKEYERRLENLNHEAEQLKSMQTKYVLREMFDQRVDMVNAELIKLREYRSNTTGHGIGIHDTMGTFFAIGAIILSCISIVLAIILHFI